MITERLFTPEMGLRLREIRLRSGLKLDDVAARMGFTCKWRKSVVVRLESGRNRNPSLITVASLLRACGASLCELPYVLEGMANERIILVHVTRRTNLATARRTLRKILPKDVLDRVTFLMARQHAEED